MVWGKAIIFKGEAKKFPRYSHQKNNLFVKKTNPLDFKPKIKQQMIRIKNSLLTLVPEPILIIFQKIVE